MELFFVYNANSRLPSKVYDALHKVVSPSTYDCELCELTHHSMGARKKWKDFVVNSKIPLQVWYKDMFISNFHEKFEFPVVLYYDNSRFTRILDKNELNALNDLDEFFVLLNRKLALIENE